MAPSLRATAVIGAQEMGGRSVADEVVLDYDHRHRRRLMLTTEGGMALLLDLSEARHLREGEGLEAEDGSVIRVVCSPEPVLDITASSPVDLVRIAWHLGNRHLPVQVMGSTLRIRHDHVIADMVRGLGGRVDELTASFDPEGGAYRQDATLGHSHEHQ